MALSTEQAAFLVRATARISSVIFASDLVVMLSGLVFYAACVAVLRVKLRRAAAWDNARQRWTEVGPVAVLSLLFLQAYVVRILD